MTTPTLNAVVASETAASADASLDLYERSQPAAAADHDQKMVTFARKHRRPARDDEVPSAIKVRSSPDSPLSPSSRMTSPTILESPTMETMDSTTSGNGPRGDHQTVTIEHNVKGRKRSSTARKISKPVIAAIGAIFFITTGSAAYFFSEFLTIPGLKTQVDRLEDQVALLESQIDDLESQVDRLGNEVDRLGGEVDRLVNETDRLEELNEVLELNVGNYTQQNERLNSTLVQFAELNNELNETVLELRVEVNGLTQQNVIFAGLNDELNQTVILLSQEVVDLESINGDLFRINNELWQSIDRLSNETAELSLQNEMLNATVANLDSQVANMSSEIDRLANVTTNLATLVSFLDETALSIDESFETFTVYLADQVVGYRSLVMETLENLYRQRTAFWDCDFREYFSLDTFTKERDAPIGPSLYPVVIEYIEERVLSDLCLNTTDFELFLAKDMVNTSNVSNASFNLMKRSVGRYTDLAVYYYFAARGDGITSELWSEANYNCDNLPLEVRYQYKPTTIQTA